MAPLFIVVSPDSIGMQGERSPYNVGVNFKTGVPTSQNEDFDPDRPGSTKQLKHGIDK